MTLYALTNQRKFWISPVTRIGFFLFSLCLLFAGACDAQRLSNGGTGGSFSAPSGSPVPQADAGATELAAREIEDADIVKVVGNRVYALNRFKGLIIIDVTNPDAPAILGHYDLRGRGVEMYVVGSQVFALLSADYYFPYIEGGPIGASSSMIAPDVFPPPAPDFDGSQLAIIDANDPAAPTLQGKINLVGFANDSRRVGNVIYVVGRNLIPYEFDSMSGDDHIDEGFVASINVADPANIIPVQRETFAGAGLEMHVSANLLSVASNLYDFNNSQTKTRVQMVDITDPTGVIDVRGSVDVPGSIRNRFYMDDFGGVFRIATESGGFGFRKVRVYTYDLADLDNVAALGQVDVIQGESLEAVRFDGLKGYLVTFLRVDPLFVVDLSNPAAPGVSGQLEVPGFSTHIEPRGNRLIAVGIDDTDGRRPAVAYYNVEDPANPSQIGRIVLGPPGSFTESEAVYDEKAFKIVDELGLIAVPFTHYDYESSPGMPVPPGGANNAGVVADYFVPNCTSGVQLVDFSDSALTQRGFFEHEGRVERVGVVGSRVFSLSQAGFQTVDITDRDTPTALGSVAFFTADEMSRFAIGDCGYYFPGPIDPGFSGFNWLALLQSMCGAMGLLPIAVITMALMSGKYSIRRRGPARR